MFRIIATAVCCIALSWGAAANDAAKLVGTWKLVSFVTEFQDGSPARPVLGVNAKGYAIFTADGRQLVYLESEGRTPAKNDEDRVKLFSSMLAITGMYRVDGGKYILKVDGASNPTMVGTERISDLKLDGDRLNLVAPWAPSPLLPGNPMTRGVTVWQRVK